MIEGNNSEIEIISQDVLKRKKENKIIRIVVYIIAICLVVFIINKLYVFIVLNNEKNTNKRRW